MRKLLFEVLESEEFKPESDYITFTERTRRVVYCGGSKEEAEKAERECEEKAIVLSPVE